MATIEDFILRINVQGQGNIKAVSASINDLKKDVDAFGQVGGPLSNTINGIVGRLGGMATAGLAAATIFAGLGLRAVQLADALQDISDATGISAGALSNFKNSLIEAGGKADDFSAFATKLTQTLGEAATGNEAAQKSFQKLGVFVRDANGNVRDSNTVLQEVIGKLAGISDPATRSAMAVELLGKQAKMIDWTKVNAINDPFKDEQVKQLAKYQEAIDKISNSVTNGLITAFGKLAIYIDEASKKAEEAQKAANERGNVIDLQPFSGQPYERPMTKNEKDRYELQKKLNEAYKDQQREMRRLQSIGQTGAGDFGAESEANAKARIENEKRIQQSIAETAKLERLKGANDLMAIDINAQAEIAKAKLEINAKERLTDQQKAAEIAAKTAEIEQKAANETAKYRSQQNAKIYSELEAQRQKSADELAAEETRINAIVEKTRQLVVEQEKLVKQTQDRNKFNNEIALLSDRERANRKEIFDLEEQRKKIVEDIKNTSDLPYAEQLEKIKGINTQFEERKRLAREQQQDDRSLSENFQAGFQRAYANYAESARNAFEQANTYFTTFTRGFEDAWVKMIQTGKFGWKDLVNTMIAELARAQIRGTISNLLGSVPASSGGSGGLFGGTIIPGFLASGGPAMAGKPYIVGEKGPELFVPRSSGTVVPNGGFGGGTSQYVTYNISAVDAMSFKAMIARDPGFIHAVAQQGASGIPSRR
jgi:lambda family phage tail tape measure protein